MKRVNSPILENQSLAGVTPAFSSVVDIRHMVVGTVQYVVAGASVAGSVEVQISCDEGDPNDEVGASVVNWGQYQAPISLTSTGVFFVHVPAGGYIGANWLRVKFTPASGVGTINIRANFKGA